MPPASKVFGERVRVLCQQLNLSNSAVCCRPGTREKPHLLPTGQGAFSKNAYLFSGALQGWRQPKVLRALTNSAARFVFRIPTPENPTNSITGPATWLEFLDQDTNVTRSQVADDSFDRYYFASPSQTPQYNPYARIVAGKPAWQLGVPPPGCAPEVSVVGGGNSLVLGNSSSGGGSYAGLANEVYIIPVQASGATTLIDVVVNSNVADPNAHFAAVIYSDNNGTPDQLLNTGAIVTGVVAGPNESAFTNPTNLAANTQYWLGFIVDSAESWGNTQGSPNNMIGIPQTFSNGPPITIEGGNTGLPGINMFGNFQTQDVIEARAYVYTWISAYGEEGPPSPPTIVNGWSNGVWTIGLYQPPATDLGVTRNLAILRLYRTVSAVGGATVFFFVTDVSLGSSDPDAVAAVAADTTIVPPTATYQDTILDSVVALNNQLPSTNWFPPPVNLQGLTVMPNGILAGFETNNVWFCDPYHPHAWPPGNVVTVEFPIVGLGLTNGALVICTSATPYVLTGNTPGQMTLTKCSAPNPCLSRGSILSGDADVTYMSPNGLIQVTSTGVATNTTDLWFTREQWEQLTPQKYTRAIYLASCYYALGSTSPLSAPGDNSVAQQGFTIELDQDNTSFTIWPQPGGHRLGFNELSSPLIDAEFNTYNVDNVETDPWTGIGLVVGNGNVYYFDFTDPAPTMIPYEWTSKIYQQNTKKNYAAIKVFFTVPPNTPALGASRNELPANDSSWNSLAPNQYLTIKTFVDIGTDAAGNPNGSMVLIDAREVRKSGELLRIISGFKCEQWQFTLTGRILVSNVQIATTAKELANV
jgi:hypothetical protein